jgi:FMN phosphatase YigB (HAD superfamily)
MDTQFAPTDKVLFIDFDHTCYDTDMFLLTEIRQPMLNLFNISTDKWEKSYENAVQAGYSLEQHLTELIKIMSSAPYTEEEMQSFGEKINFNKYLYEDSIPFLKNAREKGYKIMLLSFGAPSWQNKKVLGVGLDKFVDEIRYTKAEGNKLEVLRQYANHLDRIIFIDNNGIDLDAVKKECPNIETYYISRPREDMSEKDTEYMKVRHMESRKIAERTLLFKHQHCTDLKSITF